MAMVEDFVRALNSLYSGEPLGIGCTGGQRLSKAQAMVFDNIRRG